MSIYGLYLYLLFFFFFFFTTTHRKIEAKFMSGRVDISYRLDPWNHEGATTQKRSKTLIYVAELRMNAGEHMSNEEEVSCVLL